MATAERFHAALLNKNRVVDHDLSLGRICLPRGGRAITARHCQPKYLGPGIELYQITLRKTYKTNQPNNEQFPGQWTL
jgi:hypothetical protein